MMPAPASLTADPPQFIYSAQGSLIGARDVVGFGAASFHVHAIARDMANEIVAANHYSRKFYSGSRMHLGVFIERRLAGVLQFGVAMNPASQSSVVAGTGPREYLELNRMWMADEAPHGTESRALAYAIRYIRAVEPQVKWIQSFADERCGKWGAVYQAANFKYCGMHIGRFWELDGDMYHDSILTDSRKMNTPKGRRLRANKGRAVCHDLRQFRYIYFMAPRFAKACNYKFLSYPKPGYAAGQSDERGSPACEAGAFPAGRSTNDDARAS